MKRFLTIVAALWLMGSVVPVHAQGVLGLPGMKPSDTSTPQTSDQEVRELLRLLSKPDMVEKLRERLRGTTDGTDQGALNVSGLKSFFQETLIRIEVRVQDIVQAAIAVPELSNALSAAWHERWQGGAFLQSAIYVIIFLFGGFGLEWLYWSYLSGSLKRVELSTHKIYGRILKAAALRAALRFGSIAVFTFGSIGFLSASLGRPLSRILSCPCWLASLPFGSS